MFGLMRFQCGSQAVEEQRRWRMHYCGTCKTIGSRYGQRARLLLNHDAAFLAELLDSLTGADAEQWTRAYRSWNCMRLPADEEMPPLLRYVAAANILLGEYKVRDHEEDSRSRRWVWIRRCFSPVFRKAQRDLSSFGFPLQRTAEILSRQGALEAVPGVSVEQVAEPTAEVTALVFRHGARLAGLEGQSDAIGRIGYQFGRLIYLLDSWQDYDRDTRTGAFNAIRASGMRRDEGAWQIRRDGTAIVEELASLGAPVEFGMRLRANVEAALGTRLTVLHSCTKNARVSLAMRWREALVRTRGWQAPLSAFALVVALAFLFPRQARLAKSARECLSLGMNLMALSGIVAMVAAPMQRSRLRTACNTCCGGWDPACDCCCEGCVDSCCDGCCESCGEGCCSACDCG